MRKVSDNTELSKNIHGYFMLMALEEAMIAAKLGEVPVGAVWTDYQGKMIRCHNEIRQRKNPLAHAEMLCMERASILLGNERIGGSLYVTLEPCSMCSGAAVLARLARIVFAAYDPKGGACGTVFQIPQNPKLNHRVEIISGFMEEESASLLKSFFRQRRGKT